VVGGTWGRDRRGAQVFRRCRPSEPCRRDDTSASMQSRRAYYRKWSDDTAWMVASGRTRRQQTNAVRVETRACPGSGAVLRAARCVMQQPEQLAVEVYQTVSRQNSGEVNANKFRVRHARYLFRYALFTKIRHSVEKTGSVGEGGCSGGRVMSDDNGPRPVWRQRWGIRPGESTAAVRPASVHGHRSVLTRCLRRRAGVGGGVRWAGVMCTSQAYMTRRLGNPRNHQCYVHNAPACPRLCGVNTGQVTRGVR